MSLLELINNTMTDKNTDHSYLDTYERLFQSKKYTTKNVICSGFPGGDAKIWRDYFENATIYNVDSNGVERIREEIKNDPRIVFFSSISPYDIGFFNKNILSKDIKFDILVDDGPHTLESMLKFIIMYTQVMADEGVLVIEDIPHYNWVETLKGTVPVELKPFVEVYDLRHVKGRFDDIMFVINKNKNL